LPDRVRYEHAVGPRQKEVEMAEKWLKTKGK
jgi:hypothetical protein